MIGKITTGTAAGGVIAYVTGPGEKEVEGRAEILAATWAGSSETWASQVHEHQQAERPGFGETGAASVIHVSLNADPADGRLTADQWRAVAQEYLERMGWSGHDYAVVRHTDTQHDHVHLVIDRVGRDGQIADLHKDYERQEKVLDGIERDFGLSRTHEQLRLEAEKDPYRSVESVTRSNLTFDRAGVERYFERLGFEPDKTRELTDRALGDGRVLDAGSDRYTTREVQSELRQLDSALRSLAGQEARPGLDRGESAREGLDDGQRAAADRIAAGPGLVVVEGFAGAGKSTMLREAAADARFSGSDVIGVAPSGKAAKGLQESTGVESNTLAKTLLDIESGKTTLARDSVVIMDEAGMASNRDLAKLAGAVAEAGGRLVLVGDERQLGAVGRGGGFAHAKDIAQGGTARLDEIHRQQEGWQRDASRAFGEGRAKEAIQSYLDHGRVEWAASRGTARDMLVSDYVKQLDRGSSPDKMLALAHQNRDVRAMNNGIRDEIKERGGLQGERTYTLTNENDKSQKISVAVGDRVVFEKNDRQLGVKNGDFGTVTKTDSHGFNVRLDGKEQTNVRLENGARAQASHGYASSIHKSQGATVDRTFVLGSKGMDSKTTYVSLSRQREDVKLYANHAEHKTAKHLKNSMGRDVGRENFKSALGAGGEREKEKSSSRGAGQQKERGSVQRGRSGSEKEKSAPTRGADRDHGAGADPGKERGRDNEKSNTSATRGEQHERGQTQERQQTQEREQPGRASSWVDASLAAAAMDQKNFSSGLEQRDPGQRREQPVQERQDRASGQARHDQRLEQRRQPAQDKSKAQGQQRQAGQQQGQSKDAGKSQGQDKSPTKSQDKTQSKKKGKDASKTEKGQSKSKERSKDQGYGF